MGTFGEIARKDDYEHYEKREEEKGNYEKPALTTEQKILKLEQEYIRTCDICDTYWRSLNATHKTRLDTGLPPLSKKETLEEFNKGEELSKKMEDAKDALEYAKMEAISEKNAQLKIAHQLRELDPKDFENMRTEGRLSSGETFKIDGFGEIEPLAAQAMCTTFRAYTDKPGGYFELDKNQAQNALVMPIFQQMGRPQFLELKNNYDAVVQIEREKSEIESEKIKGKIETILDEKLN